MISTGTPADNSILCPICAKIAGSADTICTHCGNALAFPDPALIEITLSSIPGLDRELIERIRKLANEIKPQKLRIDFEKVQLPPPGVFAGVLTLVKEVKKAGGVIAMKHVDPKINDMFVMMRVDGLIEKE